ncbi:MAG: YlxR family protein [Fusobacteria bacterium]|nr:YlxR family protein [Fusobacteriota bacterium]
MKLKKTPQRSCLGCGLKTDKNKLIRIVKTPEGQVVIDKTGKAPGRGAYICLNIECLKEAIKRKSVERALNIKLSDDLIVELSNQIINE